MKLITIVTLALLSTGCVVTRLDIAQHEMHQKSIQTGIMFVQSMKGFVDGADRIASHKHRLQTKVIELTDAAFWGRHTNSANRLVSMQDGKEVPMLREDVEAFIRAREADIGNRVQSERNWEAFSNGWQTTLGMYESSLVNLGRSEAEIWEKRQEIDAVANRMIGVLGTAVGLAVGAGVAP